MPWNLFGGGKQTVSPEYLGQSLAEQILKEVFQPAPPLPSTYDRVEWLLVKTFITTTIVPQMFGQAVADRALAALHHRVWNVALGIGSKHASQQDLDGLNQRAGQCYAEYNSTLGTWLTQRNERPLMIALANNVSPGGAFDGMLELFVDFNATVQAYKQVLTEVRGKYVVAT